MNHSYTIAQPCSSKFFHKLDKDGKPILDEEGNKILDAIIKSNTHRPFVLLDELMNPANFQECTKFYTLPKPISHFTSVYKAVEDTESWSRYEYFLVAENVSIREVCNMVNDGVIWPKFKDLKTKETLYLPAFGTKPIQDHTRVITYDDDYICVGREWNARLIRRKD